MVSSLLCIVNDKDVTSTRFKKGAKSMDRPFTIHAKPHKLNQYRG